MEKLGFWNNKANKLFVFLAGFFITNALVAEFIGVKVFSLEYLFSLEAANMKLWGYENLGFNLTAGVLLWPVVFVMTDIINEYFGKRGVKFLSYMAVGLILFAFFIVFCAIHLPPADFWTTSHLYQFTGREHEVMSAKVTDFDAAYRVVFGQSMAIIGGSIIAFLIGQLVDVMVFAKIKKMTGEKKLWLRATGSTLVSQLIDSFVVLFIAFYLFGNWPLGQVLAICLVNYIYKFIVAIGLTPVIYWAHYIIDRYLGDNMATRLKEEALMS